MKSNSQGHRHWWRLSIVTVIVIALLALLGAWLGGLLNPSYQGQTTVDYGSILSIAQADQELPTVIAQMTNKRALHDVADRLGLAKRWNLTKQLALQRLDESLTVSQVSGTAKVIIEYVDDDASLAKEIPAAVATSHQAWRREINEQRSNAALDTLKREFAKQTAEVDALSSRMFEEAENPHLKDLISFGTPLDGVARVEQDKAAREIIERLRHQISCLRDLEGKELVNEVHRLGIESTFIGEHADVDGLGTKDRLPTIEEALKVKKWLPTKLQMAERALIQPWLHTQEMSEASRQQLDKLRKLSEEHAAAKETLDQMSEMMEAAELGNE